MKKDIKDMSVDEIFERLGQLITPENVFYIIKEQRAQKEYEYIYTELKSQPVLGMGQLRNFLIQNEDKIDMNIVLKLVEGNEIIDEESEKVINKYKDVKKIVEKKDCFEIKFKKGRDYLTFEKKFFTEEEYTKAINMFKEKIN